MVKKPTCFAKFASKRRALGITELGRGRTEFPLNFLYSILEAAHGIAHLCYVVVRRAVGFSRDHFVI